MTTIPPWLLTETVDVTCVGHNEDLSTIELMVVRKDQAGAVMLRFEEENVMVNGIVLRPDYPQLYRLCTLCDEAVQLMDQGYIPYQSVIPLGQTVELDPHEPEPPMTALDFAKEMQKHLPFDWKIEVRRIPEMPEDRAHMYVQPLNEHGGLDSKFRFLIIRERAES